MSSGRRQTDQQIGDLLVLIVQLRAVSIAGLADVECPAGQRNADTPLATAVAANSRRFAGRIIFFRVLPSAARSAC